MQTTLRYASFALVLALSACQGEFSSSNDPIQTGQLGTDDAGHDGLDGSIERGPDGAVLEPDGDTTSGSACGDGSVDPGETCDPCPASCDDGNACTTDESSGAPETCDFACTNTPIDVCADGDGCCPSGCDASNDDDCSASCGDGIVDANETCDPADSCTTSCDDADACTIDAMTGSPENCNVACSRTSITACVADDGCCPVGCNANTDSDCSGTCGNDVVEDGESCDGDCPTACNDADACTTDSLLGSAAACTARCQYAAITACANDDGCCAPGCNANNDNDCAAICGNGVVESGELCDGDCPTTCDDAMNCTADTMTGSAATCDAACSNTTITACAAGDGCCPPACNATTDADCASVCGNGVIESGETCDGNCPSNCGDNNACTSDARSGTAAACNVMCMNTAITACTGGDGCCPPNCNATNDSDCNPICGNNVVESGEACDGNCPASCNDNNACTTDSSSGTAGACNKTCTNANISACTGGDGCCPSGCTAANDSDCVVDCRNDATWPSNWKSFENEVLTRLNAVRATGADCGVEGQFAATGPLSMNAQLREASRCHSLDMGTNAFFSHTGSNGSRFFDRANTAGFTGFAAGENIAAGYSTPAAVVAGWVASDGHCRNLMNPNATLVGVGYANVSGSPYGHYWTMVTGR